MAAHGLPVLYALFVWWFSTGLILYLDGLPGRTYRWSLGAATALLAGAVYGIAATLGDASVTGAYLAFSCSLVVWGWHEMTFLMGVLTGPRRQAAHPGATGWRRFADAVRAILYHELAIAVTAVALVALTWEQPNQLAAWTFLVLWGMRLSTKLNIFLGVPNMAEEMLPAHLAYLKSYFGPRAVNPLFPAFVIAATVVAVLLTRAALAPGADAFAIAAYSLLATLAALAVVEHWFLVLPLRDSALWRWALPASRSIAESARPESAEGQPEAGDDKTKTEDGRTLRAMRLGPSNLTRGLCAPRSASTSWRSP